MEHVVQIKGCEDWDYPRVIALYSEHIQLKPGSLGSVPSERLLLAILYFASGHQHSFIFAGER